MIVALLCAFGFTAYYAINNIVVEQSRLQQQAVSPVYELVNQELLRPLHIAQTFAETVTFDDELNTDDIDEQALMTRLAQLEERLGLSFFVALDKPRRQYNSNGSAFDLIEGKVYWYFEALEQNKNIMADLGQVGDIHLFFDVKVFNKANEFLGFVGVGKSIQIFMDRFEEYQQLYGFNFLFVNDNNEILLSSIPDLVVIDEYVPPINELPAFASPELDLNNLDGVIVNINRSKYIVSEIFIQELDWRLLLLVPLEARQAVMTQTLISNALLTFAVVASILAAVYFIFLQYRLKLEQTSLVAPLTQLPNRLFLTRQYQRFSRTESTLCVVVCDLDRFKEINDHYGHNAGDLVLESAAQALTSHLRQQDVVGRWGGEEFVMLIPAQSSDIGEMLAERARQEITQAEIYHEGERINITASFGVAFGDSTQAMSKLIGKADVALYRAKQLGRNRVIVETSNRDS
jgi:diguanylate cyclase (GGDEF)-like protein